MYRSSQAGPSGLSLFGIAILAALGTFAAGCGKSPRPATPTSSSDTGSTEVQDAAGAVAPPKNDEAAASLEGAGDPNSSKDSGNTIPAVATSPASNLAHRKRADELYERNCAACHGAKGDGHGVVAPFLFPKPRNFLSGFFRLVSTTNNVPTLSDLDLVLTRGMPGSSMPPWPNLSVEDRRLLAERVIEFRREGIRERERKTAEELGDEVDEAEVADLVRDLTTPGPIAEVAAIPVHTPESIARGRELYLNRGCAACHADDGTGRVQQKMLDAEGFPSTARDLTKGIFKGSPDEVSIYRRTQTGIPGTPMPATPQMTHEQVSDLVHFVLSLSDEKTRNETVLNRGTIEVRSVPVLPDMPGDRSWESVPAARLRLTPLWWRDAFPTTVELRAVHDGRSIAMRLEWNDETHNARAVRPEEFEDMVAIELYPAPPEPFLGMGAAGAGVELWQWRAANVDAAGSDSLLDDYPFDTPIYQKLAAGAKPLPDFITARAGGNPLAITDAPGAALAASGPGSVTFLPRPSQHVVTKGEWKDRRWTVVFSRPLPVDHGNGLALSSGGSCSIAVAVWDGAARDRGPQKVFSLWQQLKLD